MGAPYNLLSTLSSIYTLPSLLLYIFLTFSLNPEAVFLFFLTPLHATTCQSGSALSPVPTPTHPSLFSPLCFCSELEVKEENEGRRAETDGGGGRPVASAAPAGRPVGQVQRHQ